MKINQLLQENKNKLAENSNTPQIDAEVLLCFVLNKPKEYLYTYPEYELTGKEMEMYSDFIKKRLSGAPIAHITGFKDFYGYEFIVTADTLVPRPETEMFIDYIKNQNNNKSTIIDIGTGSGCIITTLAKELLGVGHLKPQVSDTCTHQYEFIGIDISEKALDIAKQNAKKLEVDNVINFYHGNLLEPLLSSRTNVRDHFKIDNNSNTKRSHHSASASLEMTNIIITANLPYLTPDQIKNAPSIHSEPELALVAGDDGLKYYRELFKQIIEILDHKLNITILCEIDDSQNETIIELVKKELPHFSTKIKKDLAGLSRLVIIKNNF